MLAGARAIAAAVAMVCVSFAAVAQVVPSGAQLVPPSDQPGRERERFEPPAVPLAQPGGPTIAVPGIEAVRHEPSVTRARLQKRRVLAFGAVLREIKRQAAADFVEPSLHLRADVAGRGEDCRRRNQCGNRGAAWAFALGPPAARSRSRARFPTYSALSKATIRPRPSSNGEYRCSGMTAWRTLV